MQLRPYQAACEAAVYDFLRTRPGNPCAVIPTAGGKTPIMASICRTCVQHWQARVLILAHVKELLQQSADKLSIIAPDVRVGVYSAGLNSRELDAPVTVAGIQSIYNRADKLGKVDLIMIDEAHLIPAEGEGRYRTFIADAKKVNPNVRIVGFTATPYRTGSGMIVGPDSIFTDTCYEIGVLELIRLGFLSRLRTKAGSVKPDFGSLHVRGGEFVESEIQDLMDTDSLVGTACEEIAAETRGRRAVLVFTAGVEHAYHVAEVLEAKTGQKTDVITGDTPSGARADAIADFKAGRLKYLVNVNVLTTGFDAPNVDCVVLLRPTASPGLYYQMVGRGFRISPEKVDGTLVLDYGGNILRHGPVDAIRPKAPRGSGGDPVVKECPDCREIIAAGLAKCPYCNHQFPPPERHTTHDPRASGAGILSTQATVEEYSVTKVHYKPHTKKDSDGTAPQTMRVEYEVGFNTWISEWICVEHSGFARDKAEKWWAQRTNEPCPDNVGEAVKFARGGGLREPVRIKVEQKGDSPFPRIVSYTFACDVPDDAKDVPQGDDLLDAILESARDNGRGAITDWEVALQYDMGIDRAREAIAELVRSRGTEGSANYLPGGACTWVLFDGWDEVPF